MKKLRASITLSIIIFTITFMMFCICAIDAGYIVNARYKTQKVTETIALYMASILNTNPEEERNEAALDKVKERFENLYSDIGGYYGFKISEIEIKNEAAHPKVKITTETYIPTIFLRFTGIGIVRIMQTSYAASFENPMPLVTETENSYTFKTKDIITDKRGDDIKVDYNNNYFIFAGLEDFDGNVHWADISSMTESEKTKYKITDGNETYDTHAVTQKGVSYFDFSRDTEKSIGLAKYIKICPAPESDPSLETEEGEITASAASLDSTEKPVVTILNSVKLIRKSEF